MEFIERCSQIERVIFHVENAEYSLAISVSYTLTIYSSLSNICRDIEHNSSEWEAFYTSTVSNELLLPEPYGSVDALTRLILFKCLRADKVPTVIEQIVAKNLGDALIRLPSVNLSHSFEQSSAREPIVMFTTGDGDNGNELQEFVEKMGFSERFLF